MQTGESEESLVRTEGTPDEEGTTDRRQGKPPKSRRFSPLSLVCISHAFSAWGDRMWHFAIGLYLVELTPLSLRLTAIYQLVSTLSIICFGPLVGDWVDANPRLKVAQTSLIVQNVAVILCAGVLLLMLELEKLIHSPVRMFLEAVVIIIGSVADVSSIGTKIAVEKDWVVVIAGSDKSKLATTNAILRRIDLCCKILAPILVGQVMTYISKPAGVMFLAGWNVVSVFLEYYLLWKVFQSVAALSNKVFDKERHGTHEEDSSAAEHSQDDVQGSRERLDWMENEDPANGQHGNEALVPAVAIRIQSNSRKPSLVTRFKKRILTFKTGWRIYMRQSVARPGLALAALYFTVISFGAITTGYAYTQNISESILSIVRGVGSLFGVMATFVFPRLRNKIGLVRSGLFSMSLQFSCLLFCVASVFAPGSPFFLLPQNSVQASVSTSSLSHGSGSHYGVTTLTTLLHDGRAVARNTLSGSYSVPISVYHSSGTLMTSFSIMADNSTVHPTSTLATLNASGLKTVVVQTSSTIFPTKTSSFVLPASSLQPACSNCSSNTTEVPTIAKYVSHISIALLLTGIVTSRLGLWLSDLTITQLQQESVPEQERGIVAGMQSSFCSILSLLMFSLVIALPTIETFGLLALMSVAAVGIGGLLYASFAYKIRGHLFHFDKLKGLCGGGSSSLRVPTRVSQDDDLDLEDEEEAMIRGVLSTRNENFSY